LHTVEPPVLLCDCSDGDGVGDIRLAGATRPKEPRSGGQLGWHVQDELTGGGKLLGDAAAEPGGAFNGPLTIGPLDSPR
jgi:hypothetical protein